MERVTGIGGVFFRALDPHRTQRWYVEHLGLPDPIDGDPAVVFTWRERGEPECVGRMVRAPSWPRPTTSGHAAGPGCSTSAFGIWTPCWPNCAPPGSTSRTGSRSCRRAASAGSWTPTAIGSSSGNRRRATRRWGARIAWTAPTTKARRADRRRFFPLGQAHGLFQRAYAGHEREFLEDLVAHGQHPLAFFLGCSDSRVIPEVLTHAVPGELFVVRNVANLLPPVERRIVSAGAALEYAVGHLHVRHLIVCGHDLCGGIRAALDGGVDNAAYPALGEWLEGLTPVVERTRSVPEEGGEALAPDGRGERPRAAQQRGRVSRRDASGGGR